MTVANTARTAGPFLGVGTISVYAFAFKVFLTTDVLVQLTSASGVLSTGVLGTDYSVSLNTDQNESPGGNVILTVPLPAGASLTIGSQVPLTQGVVLTNPGAFYPQIVSDALDKVTILIQQALTSIAGAIRIPELASSANILPSAAQRALKLLSFDANGNPVTVASAGQDANTVSIALAAYIAQMATSVGASQVGALRPVAGAVATTVQIELSWQELSLFEFMTAAQIADYRSGAMTLDLAAPAQTWINACAASLASGGRFVGRLPPGGGRIGATLTVPGSVVLRGCGVNSSLRGWGVPVFQISGDHAVIEDMALFGYSAAGAADPRTFSAITSNGTFGANNNYARIKRLYLQGWLQGVDFHYMSGSVVDDVTTVNTNVGIRYFGQCVNNSVMNSRLVVNGGTYSIQTAKDGASQGEGLMVTNCLLASGVSAFVSDGFLLASFYNCICDLLSGYAFDVNSVVNLVIDCPWVYSAQRCVNFQGLGSALNVDAYIKIGLAQTTGAGQACVVIGANNNGIVIAGGTYVLTNAGGVLPIIVSGNNIVIGSIICRNATTNSDIQVNGTNVRISQEAYLPNGIQTVVSQIRSVVSGAVTTLPQPTGAVVERITVTGNTNCATLNDPAGWYGKIIVLVFTGTPTWTDGGNLHLSANFVATADDTLTLACDGANWLEVARSAN